MNISLDILNISSDSDSDNIDPAYYNITTYNEKVESTNYIYESRNLHKQYKHRNLRKKHKSKNICQCTHYNWCICS